METSSLEFARIAVEHVSQRLPTRLAGMVECAGGESVIQPRCRRAEETRKGKWDPRVFDALVALDVRGAADLRHTLAAARS